MKNLVLASRLSCAFFLDKFSPLNNKLLLAGIIALATILLNSSWLYNRLGESDHYAYLGAAVYFPRVLSLFPDHPIIELVPTYTLSALLYHFFFPELANLIRDYIFITLFLYMFLDVGVFITGNAIATVISTLILAGYYYFLQSIGSDYTDSAFQFLILSNLYLINKYFSGQAGDRRVNLALVLLGVTSGLLVSTGVIGLIYVFNIIFYFLLLRLYNLKIGQIFDLFVDLVSWLVGVIFCIGAISLYLYIFVNGYFMKNNIAKLFNALAGHGQYHPLMNWLPFAAWLVIPSCIFIYFIFYCGSKKTLVVDCISRIGNQFKSNSVEAKLTENNELSKNSKYILLDDFNEWKQFSFGVFLLTTTFCLIFIQFIIKQWSLQFMYFSQINFIYYLGLAIIFSKNMNFELDQKYRALLLGSTVVFASYCLNLLSHREINYESIATNFYTAPASILPWVVFIVAFLILFAAFHRKLIPPILLIVSIITFNLFSYSESHGLFCCIDSVKIDYLKNTGTTSEKYFDANFKISKFMDQLDPGRTNDIWFDEKERLGPIFKQVFSMNYFNIVDRSLINKNLPDLTHYPEQFSSAGHDPIEGKSILLMSEDSSKLAQAIEALQSKAAVKIDYDIFDLNIGKIKIFIYKTKA